MIVSVIAAVARGAVIGRDGTIPWHLAEDVARFKAVTTGHAVVMGRRTWESLPERFRPLPDRRNVVVTRNEQWSADGAERVSSLAAALELLRDVPQVFVIGGARLYEEALAVADELLLTELDLDVEGGDTFFPAAPTGVFVATDRDERVSATGIPFAFVRYRRER